MSVAEYITPNKKEITDLGIIIIVLSTLFSITQVRLNIATEFFEVFIVTLIFLTLLLGLRLIVIKFAAYNNCYQVFLHQTYFNKFGLHPYDSLKYYAKKGNIKAFKGIPSSIISILLYVLSFGLLIFPSMWRYKTQIIPHKFMGTQSVFEVQMGHVFNQAVSHFREAKVFFVGFLYYFVFAFVMKLFLQENTLNWYFFMVFYIAFFTILPIPGTEGFELFIKHKFAWICALTVLILGMFSILIFSSTLYTIITFIVVFLIVLLMLVYKEVMH